MQSDVINSHKQWLCNLLFDCLRVKQYDDTSSIETIKLVALIRYLYKSMASVELVSEATELKRLILEAHDFSQS